MEVYFGTKFSENFKYARSLVKDRIDPNLEEKLLKIENDGNKDDILDFRITGISLPDKQAEKSTVKGDVILTEGKNEAKTLASDSLVITHTQLITLTDYLNCVGELFLNCLNNVVNKHLFK